MGHVELPTVCWVKLSQYSHPILQPWHGCMGERVAGVGEGGRGEGAHLAEPEARLAGTGFTKPDARVLVRGVVVDVGVARPRAQMRGIVGVARLRRDDHPVGGGHVQTSEQRDEAHHPAPLFLRSVPRRWVSCRPAPGDSLHVGAPVQSQIGNFRLDPGSSIARDSGGLDGRLAGLARGGCRVDPRSTSSSRAPATPRARELCQSERCWAPRLQRVHCYEPVGPSCVRAAALD